MDQNLNWIDHINKLTKSLYSSLQILKRFKRSTPFKTRKTLAEGLILSKLNYCNAVYAPSQQYLLNRLQRLQTCTAGYVTGKYAKSLDVINLKWLPVEENISFSLAKYAFKALHDQKWPSYLPITTVERRRELRSNGTGLSLQNGNQNTFQNQVAKTFNDLPKNIRECQDEMKYCKEAKSFYFDQALAKSIWKYE